jgi:hypothetical protein
VFGGFGKGKEAACCGLLMVFGNFGDRNGKVLVRDSAGLNWAGMDTGIMGERWGGLLRQKSVQVCLI